MSDRKEEIEALKDKIRETFPDLDKNGKVQLNMVWARFKFSSSEWGHSYINLIKEPMKAIGISEKIADVGKYIIGALIPFILLALLQVG